MKVASCYAKRLHCPVPSAMCAQAYRCVHAHATGKHVWFHSDYQACCSYVTHISSTTKEHADCKGKAMGNLLRRTQSDGIWSHEMLWWRNGRALDLRSRGRGFDFWVGAQLRNDCGQVAHTRLPSASKVTTIWCYTNLYIIVIIKNLLYSRILEMEEPRCAEIIAD